VKKPNLKKIFENETHELHKLDKICTYFVLMALITILYGVMRRNILFLLTGLVVGGIFYSVPIIAALCLAKKKYNKRLARYEAFIEENEPEALN